MDRGKQRMRVLGDIVRGLALAFFVLVMVLTLGLCAAAWAYGPGPGLLLTAFALGAWVLCLEGIDVVRGR
jgi:hypothetical protein